MAKSERIFERTEKKYVVTAAQAEALLKRAEPLLGPDEFGPSTVCSLYFDTPDFRLIRASLEKPMYKEKMRLRCYGVPRPSSRVFLEIKKKLGGTVYKRREIMMLREAEQYLLTGRPPADTQILREIDAMIHFYGLRPAALVCCEREAFAGRQDPDLRLTLDSGLRCRTQNVWPSRGAEGTPILRPELRVLEIKALGAMPLPLADALDALRIYPCGVSKYGMAYERLIRSEHTCQPSSSPSSRAALRSAPISSAR